MYFEIGFSFICFAFTFVLFRSLGQKKTSASFSSIFNTTFTEGNASQGTFVTYLQKIRVLRNQFRMFDRVVWRVYPVPSLALLLNLSEIYLSNAWLSM